MKNQMIVVIAGVLIIVLGIQTYMVFQLNIKLEEWTQMNSEIGGAEIKIPKLLKQAVPKSDQDEYIF